MLELEVGLELCRSENSTGCKRLCFWRFSLHFLTTYISSLAHSVFIYLKMSLAPSYSKAFYSLYSVCSCHVIYSSLYEAVLITHFQKEKQTQKHELYVDKTLPLSLCYFMQHHSSHSTNVPFKNSNTRSIITLVR